MKYSKFDGFLVDTQKKLDKPIQKRAGEPTEQEIYQARWVWYHTILAAEIFLTNVLLIAILVVLI